MRHRSYLYEVPVFYLALFAAQRTWVQEPHVFLGLHPSPYWLGILLFGLRYGLGAGLYAGLFSAGLTLELTRLAGEAYRLDDLDFYLRPGLFMVIGAAIGGVTDRFRHRIAALEARIADLQDRNRGLLEQLQAQQKAQRAIEQQVVSQMSSIVTLYHGSRDLGSLERNALMQGMLDFFTQALQATKASLYAPDGGRWALSDQRGWQETDAYPRVLEFGKGIVGMAGAEKRVVSLRDLLEPGMDEFLAAIDKAGAIMAGPLTDSRGEVAAVYSVQAMPFLKFNSASVNLLTLLLDWGGEALAKCEHFEELRSKSIMNEEFGVYSERYFRTRFRQEFFRSKTYALPFSVLLVGARGLEGLSVDRQAMLLGVVGRLLNENAREMDLVAKTTLEEAPFAVLMTTATRDQAEELRSRILEGCAKLSLPAELRVGVGSFDDSMNGPEALLEQAKQKLG